MSDARNADDDGQRLHKVMAAAGVASRRVSEGLIARGRVSVNGQVVTEPGRRVIPSDRVAVNGIDVQLDASKRYVMLNKPVGVVSSMADERGRPDLRPFVAPFDERLFNVGRLDADTSGLLLLTNDGELAHTLAHPSFGVSKTYVAKVSGTVRARTIATLMGGIELDDGMIAADRARVLGSASGGASLVEITLHSGRNRVVRRMLAVVGHPVLDLVRRQFGSLTLGSLAAGRTRELDKMELGRLLRDTRISTDAPGSDDPAGDEGEEGRA